MVEVVVPGSTEEPQLFVPVKRYLISLDPFCCSVLLPATLTVATFSPPSHLLSACVLPLTPCSVTRSEIRSDPSLEVEVIGNLVRKSLLIGESDGEEESEQYTRYSNKNNNSNNNSNDDLLVLDIENDENEKQRLLSYVLFPFCFPVTLLSLLSFYHFL